MQYKFRIKNGVTLQILREKLPFTFRTYKGMIVLYDGYICYYNEFNGYLISLDALEDEISEKSKENWRSIRYKEKWMEYFTMVLREMKSIKRDFTIDEVLNPYDFDPLILAC